MTEMTPVSQQLNKTGDSREHGPSDPRPPPPLLHPTPTPALNQQPVTLDAFDTKSGSFTCSTQEALIKSNFEPWELLGRLFFRSTCEITYNGFTVADPGGGGQGGHAPPPCLVQIGQRKMTTEHGGL